MAHVHRLVKHDGPLQDVGSDLTPGCGAGQVRAGPGGMGVELCSPAGTSWRSRAVPVERNQPRGSCRNSFQACKRWLHRGGT